MDIKNYNDVNNANQKRSNNFRTNEIEFLLKLVESKKNIIECKKTDRTSSDEKINCWKEIETEFNSAFGCYRSYKTLKTKYENIKKDAKKNFALDRIERYKTGGGPKPPSKITTFDENVLNIVQQEQMIGHESIYDDDKIENNQKNIIETESIDVPDNSSNGKIDGNERCSEEFNKWKHYSPKMLQNKKHQALTTTDKKTTKDVWADVAKIKIKKVELEMETINEEWKLKKKKIELEIIELEQKIKLNKLEIESKQNKPTFPKEF